MNILYKLILFILIINPAFADYYATGQIKGQSCSGWGVKSCKFVNIFAVDDRSGRLYNVKKKYKKVDEYSNNHCYIKVKKHVSKPNFYTKTSAGNYKKVDIDYLQFNCQKR